VPFLGLLISKISVNFLVNEQSYRNFVASHEKQCSLPAGVLPPMFIYPYVRGLSFAVAILWICTGPKVAKVVNQHDNSTQLNYCDAFGDF
jgi:hypothetical protein